MCGIFGYVGGGDVCKILHQGLKSLEYRGYDSAGMAVVGNSLSHVKDAGMVDKVLDGVELTARRAGIAHTRWATHGKPTKRNAHPHFDCKGRVAIVHNGIIENYAELKKRLISRGHKFKSQTDTEVLPHLISENLKQGNFEAFKKAISEIKGSFAVAALIDGDERVYFARNFSPLVLGVNDNHFVASDIVAFLRWTNQAVFINDGEMGYVSNSRYYLEKDGREIIRNPTKIEWNFEEAAKEGYDHFMLKEIFEQPLAINNTLADKKFVDFANYISNVDKLVVTSAGTSYHAGLAFKYNSQIHMDVIVASEFSALYRGGDVFAISQSGETADTLRAIRDAKSHGAPISSLVNVIGSTMTRISDRSLYTHAGPEIGVAATKTFTSQMAALHAVEMAMKGKPSTKIDIHPALKLDEELKRLAQEIKDTKSMFFLGRGPSYATAMEGALKMKELSYIHAEAQAGGELKHGPLALIEDGIPVVAICPNDGFRDKMIGNIEEVKSRGAFLIALGNKDDRELADISDRFYGLPATEGMITTIMYTVPMQSLAYHTAVALGRNPDKPRNLAKSVTVE